MFLVDVARTRYDEYNNFIFDGKLGIRPSVTTVFAKRDSKNRPKTALEL